MIRILALFTHVKTSALLNDLNRQRLVRVRQRCVKPYLLTADETQCKFGIVQTSATETRAVTRIQRQLLGYSGCH